MDHFITNPFWNKMLHNIITMGCISSWLLRRLFAALSVHNVKLMFVQIYERNQDNYLLVQLPFIGVTELRYTLKHFGYTAVV